MDPQMEPLIESKEPSNGLCKILCVYLGLGTALMGTYVWGVVVLNSWFAGNAIDHEQVGAMNLWGSIYDNKPLLGIYYFGFVCAIVGYFMNLAHILQVAHSNMSSELYDAICFWFTLFFVTELFWMPGCVAYIATGSPAVWWALFIQLKFSGVSAVMWAWHNIKGAQTAGTEANNPKNRGCPWLGALGAVLFAAHCAVLDGCIWSFYFEADGRFPPFKA